jgi:uncharacterized tellurite resistance protein B-like protein
MGFWDLFSTQTQSQDQANGGLHKKVEELFPGKEDNQHILMTCIAGLLARIAYVDFEIHTDEEAHMIAALSNWGNISKDEAKSLSKLAITEIKELSGLDQRKYCTPLNELLDNDSKFELVKCLFQLAASDGKVENNESEEIRLITTAFLLEQRHYIAARATIKDRLAALKA